jgi:hypothetical protein
LLGACPLQLLDLDKLKAAYVCSLVR